MKRYYPGDDPEDNFFKQDEPSEDPDLESEYDDMPEIIMDEEIEVRMILMNKEISYDLLKTSINLASSDFFWRFRTTESKLKRIDEIYQGLLQYHEPKQE